MMQKEVAKVLNDIKIRDALVTDNVRVGDRAVNVLMQAHGNHPTNGPQTCTTVPVPAGPGLAALPEAEPQLTATPPPPPRNIYLFIKFCIFFWHHHAPKMSVDKKIPYETT